MAAEPGGALARKRVDGAALRRRFAANACWVCIAGALIGTAVVILNGTWNLLLGAGGVFTLGCMGLVLLRLGFERFAFWLLALGGWVVVVAEPAFSNGLYSAMLVALPIVLLLAAWLMGIRAAVWLGVATVPVLFVYAYLQAAGAFAGQGELPLLPRALVLAIIVLIAAALGYFATRTLDEQLGAVEEARRELEANLAQLAKRDEELSLLTERVPAMIARYDADLICRFGNSAYARFHGWDGQAIVGKSAREILGERAFAEIEAGMRRALAGEPNQQTVVRDNASGEARILNAELVPATDAQGKASGWYALIRDVTETERVHRALRHIVEGTARATGTDFFRALVQNLAQATGLARAMVAEILPGQRQARALAYWTGDTFRDGVSYEIAGSPCEIVLREGVAYFRDEVAVQFPLDRPLAELGLRGYFGMRLDTLDGTPMGHLVVMDQHPLGPRADLTSLVSVFAARAAGELERIRAEELQRRALERFEAIFQFTPNVAIQGFDPRGRVLHWNRASEKIYGIPSSEALGQPIQTLLHTPETAREFEPLVAGICARRQATEPAEWPVPLRAGGKIWVLSTLFPVFTGDGQEVAEIFRMDVDITALKAATDQTREANIQLEARVAARTAELADLNRELEAFSYSVSHDLRAPLRSIQGFGSILEERSGAALDATSRDCLQRMVRAAQRLAQLIDDLLELTRINRAEIHPVAIDLGALAREIIDELRHGAPERSVEARIAPQLSARGDPRLMRLALQNLLDNAWKYSGKLPQALIEVGCREDAGERAFYVRDNGAGFDMAYANKLFTPFQRLHNPRDFEGTGIGLATVARVIHRHGGRVWAASAPGKGAEFCFTLPA